MSATVEFYLARAEESAFAAKQTDLENVRRVGEVGLRDDAAGGERVLGGKVAEERTLGDTGAFEDVVDLDVGVAGFAEKGDSSVDDARPQILNCDQFPLGAVN